MPKAEPLNCHLLGSLTSNETCMQEQASANGIDLKKTTVLPATAKYAKAIEAWFHKPYPALATAIWAVELSYFKVCPLFTPFRIA